MIPGVSITKLDGQTGVVRPSNDGILAIIASSQSGTANQPTAVTRQDTALTAFGYGPLVDVAGHVMAVAAKPVVLIKGTASVAATNGTVTHTGAGTSVVTATGTPLDDYDVLFSFIAGGTIGVAGITFTYSLDGGKTTSGVTALGTANSYTIANSGVTISFAAGTVLAAQTEAFSTKGPRMNSSDVTTALEALRTYGGSWEAVLLASTEADNTIVGNIDTWLAAREGEGKFRTALCNSIFRVAASQTEAQYLTAMTTAFASTASTRVLVGADQAYTVSPTRGIRQRRMVAMGMAARGMAVDISQDIAYVATGALSGHQLSDDRGNPLFHDELLYPGLDDIRLATLRTFNGREGVYVNNPVLISASGSDYVYWQHARVMNKACEVAFQLLTGLLSKGVRRNSSTGFIFEEDAQSIENIVQAELEKQLKTPGRVTDVVFTLARNDDLTSNSGATVTAEIQIIALSYIKRFNVNTRFTKTLRVLAGQ